MSWDDQLLPDQRKAASYSASSIRLLAGPGTGKTLTLTKRILFLTQEMQIPAEGIVCLTFTRAAAMELRKRVQDELGEDKPQPRIRTLHSFSLRQLLKNSSKIELLPQPLRIADDWEERNIIQEDIKDFVGNCGIKEIQRDFNLLSSDWETLSADGEEYTPDPKFIGAWKDHRALFGYTLRAELVYQLKKALEYNPEIELETPITHLLVDEYQDLNKCDLTVINYLVKRGSELFVAGDDDQSIYGFRNAYPEGIRNFLGDYPGSKHLSISTCMRCDKEILKIAEFVADQDYKRIDKGTVPKKDAMPGEVLLYRFRNQKEEARKVVEICKSLLDDENYSPNDILLLSRSDTNRAFSRVLKDEFLAQNVPFTAKTSRCIFDEKDGRKLLAFLRLLDFQNDSLSWRTLIQLMRNGIGSGKITTIIEYCLNSGQNFYQGLQSIKTSSETGIRFANQIKEFIEETEKVVKEINNKFSNELLQDQEIRDLFFQVENYIGIDNLLQDNLLNQLQNYLSQNKKFTLHDFLQSIQTVNEGIEQELSPDSINMLTMHKAKGLSARAVIIIGAEDQLIPGRQESEPDLGDERRLLFVSLSRARNKLIISYCTQRTGQQKHLGRQDHKSIRTITRFLRESKLKPIHPS